MTEETVIVWTGAEALREHIVPTGSLTRHPKNPRQGVPECAYLAGIIDGEGCVGVYHRAGPRYGRAGGTARVYVCNTDRRILDWIAERFGGNVYTSRASTQPGWKTVYAWQATGKPAASVINEVLPYLVAKREQALLALEFIETQTNPGRRGHSDATLARRREIFAACSRLNRKGVRV